MMREARQAYSLTVLEQHEIFVRDGVVQASNRELQLTGETHTGTNSAPAQTAAARIRRGTDAQRSAVRHGIPVRDPPAGRPERQGAKVYNKPQALRDFNEKAGDPAVQRIHRADTGNTRAATGHANSPPSTAT